MQRTVSIDSRSAQRKEQGGYRQFFEMSQNFVYSDVSFTDDFIVEAKANATLYFALRLCAAGGIPIPMRIEASVKPVSATPSFGAVCLASGLKQSMTNKTDVRSVFCESDVGECFLQT